MNQAHGPEDIHDGNVALSSAWNLQVLRVESVQQNRRHANEYKVERESGQVQCRVLDEVVQSFGHVRLRRGVLAAGAIKLAPTDVGNRSENVQIET